jgi:hypothetical protein
MNKDAPVYEKPEVQDYGDLRELTQKIHLPCYFDCPVSFSPTD